MTLQNLNSLHYRVLKILKENPTAKAGPISIKLELVGAKLLNYTGEKRYELTKEGEQLLKDQASLEKLLK